MVKDSMDLLEGNYIANYTSLFQTGDMNSISTGIYLRLPQ